MTSPPPLTADVVLTLAIGAGALVLFIWNRLRMDLVGFLTMMALILTGVVTPAQGISGFSSEATITVGAMFVLSAGLVRTGGVDLLGRWLERLAGASEFRLLLLSLLIVIPASAFVNNTPVVVVMIPLLLGIARKNGFTPSRLFMPVSFASQMGGTLTLIGTSTNLLVAGLVLDLGLERIGLFEITPPALVLAGLGVVYLLTVGRWLTPVRKSEETLEERYELGEYLSGLVVEPGSDLVGRTLEESRFAEQYGLDVVSVEREGERIDVPTSDFRIEAEDRIAVLGKMADLARAEARSGLRITGAKPGLLEEEGEGVAREPKLAEVIVPLRSRVVGQTLRALRFRQRYGVPVMGVRRHGLPLHEPMRNLALEAGDILLVRGTPEDLRRMHRTGDLALLGTVELPTRRSEKLRYAVPILAAVVVVAALGVTTILVSALLGVAAMFLTGCLTPDEAYREVDWMVLVLLGTILPLGIAMQNTGAAELLAFHLLALTEPLGPYGTLAAFYLLTSLLTEVISNNAAAVVLTPLAVAAGVGLGLSPLPFVVAVMMAASNSFMTPIGYQTNTFIFGPGGYRFSDFLRIGGPLNFLLLIAATFVIPVFFPF
jgi:di/tricarboxylate transporter